MATLTRVPKAVVERATELSDADLHDLCEGTDMAILDGGGFGWLTPPPRERLEAYWRGVLLVPERELFIARLEGVVCGSAQLVRPPTRLASICRSRSGRCSKASSGIRNGAAFSAIARSAAATATAGSGP